MPLKVGVSYKNIKLLSDSVTYIAITEREPAFYNRNSCALQKIPPA